MKESTIHLRDEREFNEVKPRYRIILGDIIDLGECATYPYDKVVVVGSRGSIGVMDITLGKDIVPVKISKRKKNKRFLEDDIYDDCELRRVLSILLIGIDPQYHKRGFATHLVKQAEKIASENGLGEIVIKNISNQYARRIFSNLGYLFYENLRYGIKKLERP